MSKLVIVIGLSENAENPDIRNAIRETVSRVLIGRIKAFLEEYQNYEFIKGDFTVEVTEQNGD